jgi:Polyketide cyclase / dehydrase and lipid transport
MLPRTDYSVVVPVSVELAFRAFSDLERLLHREIYQEASWIEGNPWEVGSRIRYVVSTPVKATISAVVTSYEPPRYVALLNHGMGITAEQQVTFTGSLRGETRVRMIMDFVGKSPDLPEDVVQQAVTLYTHDALDSMAALCQRWKVAASSR